MESYPYQRADVEKLLGQADTLELSKRARTRLRWILHSLEHEGNVSLTCRHFDISRTTFYNCLTRFDPDDPASLEDRSKAPKRVPQPETDERTVALIGEYRKQEVLLSKERISERLLAEHGITLSASTVGRIINRYGFYFADSPLHQEKRRAVESRTHGDSVTRTCQETAQKTRTILASEDENNRNAGWQKAAAIIIAAAGASFAHTESAHALEGSTYQLRPTFDAVGGELEGASFTIDGGALTAATQVLQGSDYRVTIPAPASSSSSEASSASPSSAAASDGPTGGGRRTIPAAQSSSSLLSASPAPTPPTSPPSAPSPSVTAEPISSVSAPASATTTESGVSATLRHFDCAQCRPSTASASPSFAIPSNGATSAASTMRKTGSDQELRSYHEAAPPIVAIPVSPKEASLGNTLGTTTILIMILAGVIGRSWLLALRRLKKPLFARHLKWRRSIRIVAYLARKTLFVSLLGLALLAALLWNIAPARAATTVPQNHWYQGHLLNSDGSAVTTAVTIRFSEWKSTDFTASDLTATGSINTSAADYLGWEEEHTLTPESDGSFAVKLGSINILPDFSTLPPATLLNLTLQVDVKASGAADSTYDLLDADTSNTAVDRTSVLSLPFARNADLLDQRDIGTGSGAIPVLSSGASLSLNGDLTINADAEARDAVLTFGNNILNETLKFSAADSRFEFSHGLLVDGNLTATGSLNILGTMSGKSLQVTGTGANPLIYTDTTTGNVGIGTTAPSQRLDVNGNIFVGSGTNEQGTVYLGGNNYIANAGHYLVLDVYGYAGLNLSTYGSAHINTYGTERVTVLQGGDVGIGTTTPETKLEVAGTMSGRSLQVTGTGAAPLITTNTTTGKVGIGTASPEEMLQVSGGSILLDNAQTLKWKATTGVAVPVLQVFSDKNTYLDSIEGESSIIFRPAGVEAMRMKDGGNVGIGTATPEAKLEVTGTASGQYFFGQNGLGASGAVTIKKLAGTGTGNIFIVDTNGLVYDATNKRVGIGTANPLDTLEVNGNLRVDGNGYINGYSTAVGSIQLWDGDTGNLYLSQNHPSIGSLVFKTGGDEKVRIDHDGNVGIGTAAPETKLEVTGTMSGKSLQVTGTGAAPLIFTNPTTGNVGIGTTAPGAKLDVQGGTINVGADTYVNSGGIYFKTDPGTWTGIHTFGGNRIGVDSKLELPGGVGANSYTTYNANTDLEISPYTSGNNILLNPTAGNVGIGTTTPETKLEVTGTASGQYFFGQNGLGASGAVTIKKLAGTGTGNIFIVDTNGLVYDATNKRVGIGTASPTAQFTLANGGYEYLNAFDNGGIGYGQLDLNRAGSNVISFNVNGASYIRSYNIYDGITVFYVDNVGGKVGIGTAAPETALEVIGTMSGQVLHAEQNITSSGALAIEGDASFEGNLTFGNDISDAITVNAGTWTFANDTNFALTGGVNGLSFDTDTLSIDAQNHRVGIGTTAPETKLEVIGTMSGSNLTVSGKAAPDKALCIKATGQVGVCASAMDADGGCTCN